MRISALRDTTVPPSTDLATWPSPASLGCSAIFKKIAQACVRAIRNNRRRAIAGGPDAVHTMRIELTRLRAATLFFLSQFRDDDWKLLNNELDWLNSALGKARNLDVTIAYSLRKQYRRWADKSRRELLRSQGKVHRQLVKDLRSVRCRRLMADLDRWLKRSPLDRDKATALANVSDFSEKRLRAWRIGLSRDGLRTGDLGRAQLHRFRIQNKNYRYVVESLLDLNVRYRARILHSARTSSSCIAPWAICAT